MNDFETAENLRKQGHMIHDLARRVSVLEEINREQVEAMRHSYGTYFAKEEDMLVWMVKNLESSLANFKASLELYLKERRK